MKIAKQIDFPEGYGITLGGASRDQKEVFSEMFTALIMGIALMYLVLVMVAATTFAIFFAIAIADLTPDFSRIALTRFFAPFERRRTAAMY